MSGNATPKRRWVVFLVVGCVLGALTIVVGAVLVTHFLSTAGGKKLLFLTAGEGARITKEGMKAPGAKEVGAAGGCQMASVIAGDDALMFAHELDDAGPSGHLEMSFVVCILPVLHADPSCDDLAQTYVSAAHPTTRFSVQVKHLGASNLVCSQFYDATGKP